MNDKDKKELDDLLSLTNLDSDLLQEFIYKLQEENKNLHKIIDTVYWQILPDGRLEMLSYNPLIALENENKKLRECVEFYANKQNWSEVSFDSFKMMLNDSEIDFCPYAGMRARKTLKQLDDK